MLYAGFGDILVPGLLLSYCCSFDLAKNTHKLYFVISNIGKDEIHELILYEFIVRIENENLYHAEVEATQRYTAAAHMFDTDYPIRRVFFLGENLDQMMNRSNARCFPR